MKMVAAEAGTSQATVSDVLRGRAPDKGIRPETADRVRKVAQRLGYRPNWVAQSLVSGRTGVIGVHLPTYAGRYHDSLIRAIDLEAQARGYRVILSAPTNWERERAETMRLLEHGIDGLIVCPLVERRMAPTLEQLFQQSLAISLVSAKFPGSIPWYVDDNVAASEEAVKHLMRMGHERIGFVGRSNATRSSRERRQGYRRAMDDAGLERIIDWVIRDVYTEQVNVDDLIKVLKSPNAPTAFYCADDMLAVRMMYALQHLGLSVPEDLALVGHGDDIAEPIASMLGITTTVQDVTATANLAVTAVVDQIDRKPLPSSRLVPGRLRIRRSCGSEHKKELSDKRGSSQTRRDGDTDS